VETSKKKGISSECDCLSPREGVKRLVRSMNKKNNKKSMDIEVFGEIHPLARTRGKKKNVQTPNGPNVHERPLNHRPTRQRMGEVR